jgi:hypothetical protein
MASYIRMCRPSAAHALIVFASFDASSNVSVGAGSVLVPSEVSFYLLEEVS